MLGKALSEAGWQISYHLPPTNLRSLSGSHSLEIPSRKLLVVAPRTPSTTGGGSTREQCTGGDNTVFPAHDVRF